MAHDKDLILDRQQRALGSHETNRKFARNFYERFYSRCLARSSHCRLGSVVIKLGLSSGGRCVPVLLVYLSAAGLAQHSRLHLWRTAWSNFCCPNQRRCLRVCVFWSYSIAPTRASAAYSGALKSCMTKLQSSGSFEYIDICLRAPSLQLCVEHGINNDGILEPFATQVLHEYLASYCCC